MAFLKILEPPLRLIKFFRFLRKNWLIFLIIMSAAFLRSWQLNMQGILFSDAGRDLLVAQSAVETKQLPLVGIPSSIPRFHQGPLTIWIEMLVYYLFGHQTLAQSFIFAFIGILAVIFTYEYAVLYFNKRSALIAATTLAFSPLAIAHSRVPYHTTPIPLVILIFLFALQNLWKQKKHSLFWAVLAWILVMQFELNLFPLGLLIFYIFYRQKIKPTIQHLSQLSAAIMLGLLPQILYDFTHSFAQSQIGGFILWTAYRIVSVTGLIGNHQLSSFKLINLLQTYQTYLGRFISTNQKVGALILLGLLFIIGFDLLQKRKKLTPGIEIILVALLILTLSYCIHGSPSEAYFPPYFSLLALLVGWGIDQIFSKKLTFPVSVMLILWAGINVHSIWKYHFFVSNQETFSYHASLSEQREILNFINQRSQGHFKLDTTQDAGKFSSYFDNFYWLAREMNIPAQSSHNRIFYIEDKDSSLAQYPDIIKVEFTTYDVYFH